MLEKTGDFNKAVAVIPSTKLQEGDILVTRSKGHTVIVIEAESEDKPAHKPDKAKAEKSKKDIKAIALEVIAGKWRSGEDRKNRFKAAGYNYSDVQKEVKQFLEFYPIYS